MTSREKDLLEQLKNYQLVKNDIERLTKRLQSAGYSMTAQYGLAPGGHSGEVSSKVERLAMKLHEIKQELEQKLKLLAVLDDAIRNAGLNKRERDLIECTVSGFSLSAYARQHNIYKSHVFKIRDKALKKMRVYITENTFRSKNWVKD